MIRDPSEKSLVEILRERYDTRFHGYEIDESEAEEFKDSDLIDIYRDGNGNYWQTQNDYIQTRQVDGQRVAILVADEDDKNIGVSHPHSELPHLIGLYVREPFRSEGLATALIDEFMGTVDSDRCVVDCEDNLKAFYEQLQCGIVFLDELKG
jgi:GNAT superfamily N-acetyltransferase